MGDGDVAGRDVGDHRGDEEWRDPLAGRVVDHLGHLPELGGETTDSGTEIDSEPEGIDVLLISGGLKSGLLDGLEGGCHSVLGEKVLLADERLVHAEILGVETFDRTGYSHGNQGDERLVLNNYTTLMKEIKEDTNE